MSNSIISGFDSPQMLKALDEFQKGNYVAAFEMMLPLAEAGNPKAQCWAASFYQLGLGTAIDGRKAVELYERIAEQNITEEGLSALACNNLATIYYGGLPGVDQDAEKGRHYRELARSKGFRM